jgi:DNA-binding transcriptional regulator YiaG
MAANTTQVGHLKAEPGRDDMTEAGRSIARGLSQIIEAFGDEMPLAESPLVTVHEIHVPEPAPYSRSDVKRIRTSFGVSQALFGKMLGVSTVQIQSIEQGKRKPSPMMRRLLKVAEDKPAAFMQIVGVDLPANRKPNRRLGSKVRVSQ